MHAWGINTDHNLKRREKERVYERVSEVRSERAKIAKAMNKDDKMKNMDKLMWEQQRMK